ncbi:MAG: hypothetical protein ACI9X8_000236 [Pseudoalteromonas distincta]|jgi:hypothetical protein
MNTYYPFKLVTQELIGAIKETLIDAIGIILGVVALICILIIGGIFILMPAMVAIYFDVMPEFTDFNRFTNWVTVTTCLWSAFWIVCCVRLNKRLKGKKELSKC